MYISHPFVSKKKGKGDFRAEVISPFFTFWLFQLTNLNSVRLTLYAWCYLLLIWSSATAVAAGVQNVLFEEFLTVIIVCFILIWLLYFFSLLDNDQQVDSKIDNTVTSLSRHINVSLIILDMFLEMQITSELTIPIYSSEVWSVTGQEAGAFWNSVLH